MGREKSNGCGSCDLPYSDTRRPHVLYCGHSLCTYCLNMSITFKNLFCHICSTRFKASSASDISINYSLENCISVMRRMEFGKTLESQSEDESHHIKKLIDYQKSSAQDLILSSKNLIEDLKTYHSYLHKNTKEHKEIVTMIQERAEFHNYIESRMMLEQDEAIQGKEEVDAHIKKLESTLPELNSASSNKEVAAAVARVTETYSELARLLEQYQMGYPHPEMPSFQRVLMRSMNILYMEDFDYVKGNAHIHRCPYDDASISDKLAICNIEDFFTHKEILTCMKNDPTIVFLTLAWEGLRKGRILIKLFPGSPLAQHFKDLCAGELGPTYLRKNFSQIIDPESATERVKCEPCQGNFLSGNILQDTLCFNEEVHKHNADQGIIWMDSKFSFCILVGSGHQCTYNNVFGQVQDGISLLEDSAERIKNNLGGVEIIDTGVCLEI
ncbi:uncharacterized protein [Palaemon carinicauda]|uniref:uncharacterized protein n=1 Tax=Palaemon carinicauda TaxID=392227 RepID=UPI0035B660B4